MQHFVNFNMQQSHASPVVHYRCDEGWKRGLLGVEEDVLAHGQAELVLRSR